MTRTLAGTTLKVTLLVLLAFAIIGPLANLVLWSFAEEGVRQAREGATGSGADYVVDVVERFNHLNASFEPLTSRVPAVADQARARQIDLVWQGDCWLGRGSRVP